MNNAGHWTVWDGVLARPWYCGRTSGLDVALSGSVAGPAGAPGCRRPLWPRLLAALDTVSVSAVLTYRLATYWLPVIPGWAAWRLLQRRDYV
jgi:undecaprenyl-diphosphatase